jgi:hypothetical protein
MPCYRSAIAVESIFIFPRTPDFVVSPTFFLPPLPRAISATKQIKSTRNALFSELKISQNGWKLGVLGGNMRRMFTNRPDGPTKEKKGKAR